MVKGTTSIEALQRLIDERHRAAQNALKVLATYLTECIVPTPGDTSKVQKTPTKSGKKHRRRGTYRARVLRALSEEWKTVDELVAATKLKAARVRGVCYSPKRHEMGIEFRRSDRGAEFKKGRKRKKARVKLTRAET